MCIVTIFSNVVSEYTIIYNILLISFFKFLNFYSKMEAQGNEAGQVGQLVPNPPRSFLFDIFTIHYQKGDPIPNTYERYNVHCNYCTRRYACARGEGYATLRKHTERIHPREPRSRLRHNNIV